MQYPDTISFTSSAEATYDQNTGNWTPATPGATVESKCRYEASSGNGFIPAADGTRINFTGIVYLPKDAPEIEEGTQVTITVKRKNRPDKVLTDKVLRYFPGQMDVRIWV